jgi:opacity protein-like surface antigen
MNKSINFNRMKRQLVILIFFSVVMGKQLHAQEENEKNPILTNKFQLGIGLFIPNQNVKFGVNASSENNDIDFGETFDFSNSTVRPNMSFNWRFSKFWKLSAEYFNASYSKDWVLEEDIEIGDGDYTFDEGSDVELGYKINLYRIYVGRVISSGQKHELGAGLGAHILNAGPYIEGDVIVNGNDNEFRRAETTVTAPLPNIALWYYYAPTEKWSFSASVDWFGITVNDYSGSLWDIIPGVRYQVIKNLAVSLDYRYFKLNVDVKKDNWGGSFDMSFKGPTITFIGSL